MSFRSCTNAFRECQAPGADRAIDICVEIGVCGRPAADGLDFRAVPDSVFGCMANEPITDIDNANIACARHFSKSLALSSVI